MVFTGYVIFTSHNDVPYSAIENNKVGGGGDIDFLQSPGRKTRDRKT